MRRATALWAIGHGFGIEQAGLVSDGPGELIERGGEEVHEPPDRLCGVGLCVYLGQLRGKTARQEVGAHRSHGWSRGAIADRVDADPEVGSRIVQYERVERVEGRGAPLVTFGAGRVLGGCRSDERRQRWYER